jgi:glucose dehydrogenase
MSGRRGEKAGWIGGWAGAFLWVFILSIAWLLQGKGPEAIGGLTTVCLAAVAVSATLPWRNSRTPFWKLMLPAYIVLGLSVVWAVWSFGPDKSGFNWWSILWALPLLIPFGVAGRRRWSDAEPQQTNADQEKSTG